MTQEVSIAMSRGQAEKSGGGAIIEIANLTHRYGDRVALDNVSLRIGEGEIFGFLGPNGSGKTTLFRILSTLVPASAGRIAIMGRELPVQRDAVRQHLGVVFQSPSLDKELTAEENLRHHGHLYGLQGEELKKRIAELLERVGMSERAGERVGRFSGGMRRRVELAKGLLNRPKVLLLDEPSTGLDPGARIDLWRLLKEIRQRDGVTILLTTHLMDEADRCDRLMVLDQGKVIACDTSNAMKDAMGGDVISLSSPDPAAVRNALRERMGVEATLIDGVVRFERQKGHEFVPKIIEKLPGMIDSVSVGKPTLEDVFIRLTGHGFLEEPPDRA
jgi:ABC-2 type transport system ATP-binding protein